MIGEILNYAIGSLKINANALQRPQSYDSKKADLQREQLGTFPHMTRCQKTRTDALSLLSKYYHLAYRWYCHSNILCQNAFDILMSPKIPFCLSERLDCKNILWNYDEIQNIYLTSWLQKLHPHVVLLYWRKRVFVLKQVIVMGVYFTYGYALVFQEELIISITGARF